MRISCVGVSKHLQEMILSYLGDVEEVTAKDNALQLATNSSRSKSQHLQLPPCSHVPMFPCSHVGSPSASPDWARSQASF
ncbi:hypothetical protein PoB_004213300 [Plakobranchus ocellatus]|uniref:Uncharacterized protein n=1 Tax=Plakobranchus ocellatus TaxID=259542 RepID=A0AAV4B9Y6_9GAST|nr:hypothetical protein PoB_004213300 [Plakobranchus ocellatus]